MIYSKTCEYAIRSLACLAKDGKKAFKSAADISKGSGVPRAYVSKIIQSLVRGGILKTVRGAGGGVSFSRNPESLSLMQIIDAIDDLAPLSECAMGLDRCEDDNGCPIHEIWKKAKNRMFLKFKNTKLVTLSKNTKKLKYRKLNRLRLKVAT